jgi:hypothetical protein
MPKCLHPPCPRQVANALYCDEHKYVPDSTTNLRSEDEPLGGGSGGGWPSDEPSAPCAIEPIDYEPPPTTGGG